jgi:hypothetical protein
VTFISLAGKRLAIDANVRKAVSSWLQKFDTYFFYGGIKALVRL